jgi:plastocyanin
MKKAIIIAILVLVVVLGIYLANRPASEEPVVNGQNAESSSVEIVFTDNGFEPNAITVKKGDAAVFLNQSSKPVWPASAFHPTHTAYPGSSIEKCGTDKQDKIFDACGEIAPGESWSFVFNEIGAWKYHDHLDVSNFGSVTVE